MKKLALLLAVGMITILGMLGSSYSETTISSITPFSKKDAIAATIRVLSMYSWPGIRHDIEKGYVETEERVSRLSKHPIGFKNVGTYGKFYLKYRVTMTEVDQISTKLEITAVARGFRSQSDRRAKKTEKKMVQWLLKMINHYGAV